MSTALFETTSRALSDSRDALKALSRALEAAELVTSAPCWGLTPTAGAQNGF